MRRSRLEMDSLSVEVSFFFFFFTLISSGVEKVGTFSGFDSNSLKLD